MEDFKHYINDEACRGVADGLRKAKKIADELFGDRCRNRDTYVIYELLMSALHCDHHEKEPWEQ